MDQVGNDPLQEFINAVDWMPFAIRAMTWRRFGFGIEAIPFGCLLSPQKMMGGGDEVRAADRVEATVRRFSGEGDLMLFGELLHRFFGPHADVNLSTQLVIVGLAILERI